MTKTKEKLSSIDATDETLDTIPSRSGLSISDDLIDEIIQAREHSDSTLIAGGALQNENSSLILTPEQIENAHQEMIADIKNKYSGKIQTCLDKLSRFAPEFEHISDDLSVKQIGVRVLLPKFYGNPDKFEIEKRGTTKFSLNLPEGFIADPNYLIEFYKKFSKVAPWLDEDDLAEIINQAEAFGSENTWTNHSLPRPRKELIIGNTTIEFVRSTAAEEDWIATKYDIEYDCPTYIFRLPNGKNMEDFISAEEIREMLSEQFAFRELGLDMQEKIVNRIINTRVGRPIIEEHEIDTWKDTIIDRAVTVLESSNNYKKIANQIERNRQIMSYSPQLGDLIHGNGVSSLEAILQNGVVCNEVHSGELDNYVSNVPSVDPIVSVETSFMADFWEMVPEHVGSMDFKGIDRSFIAQEDNDRISIVIRRNDQSSYRDSDVVHSYDYIEKGYGSLVVKFPEGSKTHSGIFVGVESTDIAAIIAGGLADIEQIKIILVSNKRFIPVFDTDGKILFNYDDYMALIK